MEPYTKDTKLEIGDYFEAKFDFTKEPLEMQITGKLTEQEVKEFESKSKEN